MNLQYFTNTIESAKDLLQKYYIYIDFNSSMRDYVEVKEKKMNRREAYLNDAHSDSLTHVANREATKRREFLESFDAHRLSRLQHHDRGVSALDALRILLGGLAGTAVAFLLDLRKFASDMSGVTIEHRCITVAYLPRMIEDDHLRCEIGCPPWRLIFRISRHVTTPQLFHRNVLHVEANVVPG